MKATIKKTSFSTYPLGHSNMLQPDEQQDDQMIFTNFTIPTPFVEQQIAPPSHVWDKIADILDAQDRQKANNITQPTFNSRAIKHSSPFLVAGVACIVLAVFIWMLY